MAFSLFVSQKTFKGQLPREETILLIRRHWFVLTLPIFFIFLLALLPFLIYFFIKNFNWYPLFSSLFWFLTMIYFLILWLLFIYNLMIYLLTAMIVTNKRIIRIEQKGFFNYESATVKLERIQDISLNIKGFFPTFLNFGDLEIQTAGALVKFTFRDLPNPQKIKETIMRLMEKTNFPG